MGKLLLIAGPNGSGKSRFAESLAARFSGERYYIATMVPQTEENARRIVRHRRQRAGLHFVTMELPRFIGSAGVGAGAFVLLEDVSNLLANAMFGGGGTADTVFAEIESLRRRCALLTAVTISGLASGDYAGETAAYIRGLNALNARLLDTADAAAVLRDGVPQWRKGGQDELF